MKPDTPGYLLGLDIGSTAIKAGIFDLDGNEIATATGDAEVLTPHPGWYERRMDEIWNAAVTAADVQRVAGLYFAESNRTVAVLVSEDDR